MKRSTRPNLYQVSVARSGVFTIDKSHPLVEFIFCVCFVACCRNIIYHPCMGHAYSIHIYVKRMYRSMVSQNNFSISYITTKSSQELWKKFEVNCTNLSKDLSNGLPKLWTKIMDKYHNFDGFKAQKHWTRSLPCFCYT